VKRKPKTTPPAHQHGRRLHSDGRRRTATMMNVDDIQQAELIASEREVLAKDKVRWKKFGAGAHLDEWLEFGPGLMIRRRLAMKLANTNKPEGRGYNTAMGRLMLHDGMSWQDNTLKKSMSAVLWLNDEPERLIVLREIRETMSPGERSRLNSPISARQRVEKVLLARIGGTEAKVRQSPVANLKREVAEKDRKIAHLAEQLAAAEARDGSLFDLKHDNVEDIARVIVTNVSESKGKSIAQGILAAYKKSKPAG
jgi:hypothetical protein